jgi:hypothetical protein
MKIGIITFHCSYNYGSAIQAFALQTFLTEHGHEVQIIDYVTPDFNQYHLFRFTSVKSLFSDIYYLPKNLFRRTEFKNFQRKYLNITNNRYIGEAAEQNLAKLSKSFDAVICGSDQIWNLDCTHGLRPPLFLNFVSGDTKKIAYGPSLGHTNFESQNFTADTKRRISKLLNSFNAISVREKSTVSTFQVLTRNQIHVVVDPVLLPSVDVYRQIEQTPHRNSFNKKPYVFFYMLEHNSKLLKYCQMYAENNNLNVVYFSKRNVPFKGTSKNFYGVSPSVFLWLLDHANAIITNSFHATVFSAIFNKKFVTFGTQHSSSRVRDFLKSINAEDHIVSDAMTQDPSGCEKKVVDGSLSLLKGESVDFLLSALES